MPEKQLERYERTPQSEANELFDWLFALHMDRFPEGDGEEFSSVFARVAKCSGCEARGDFLTRKYKLDSHDGADAGSLDEYVGQLMETALGYGIDAYQAASTEQALAWTYVSDGTALGCIARGVLWYQSERLERTRRLTAARHAESRDMRAQAVAWYRANRHVGMTKDEAAEKIAKGVVPMKFRTVRDWLSKVKD